MGEFVNFITKGIKIEKDGDRRTFSGHISAEVVDHENDFIFVKEIMEVMKTFMKVLPVLSEVHSNRMVGKILGYEKSEIEGHPSVRIDAEIFKQKGVTLYDDVWNKVKDHTYQGLSMGGGSKKREAMFKDGRMVQNLSDLELYEIALCPSPMNPLAIIDRFNQFAKSDVLLEKMYKIDNRNIVQCNSISCEFGKGINDDIDIDSDNRVNPKPGEIKIDQSVKKTDNELGVDNRRPNRDPEKPSPEIKKDHIEGMTEEREHELIDHPPKKKDNITVSKDNHNVYKQLSEINVNNMTETTETKTNEISKDQPVKVDSMATVVTDLIKTKDTLIEKQNSEIETYKKEIEALKKVTTNVTNVNPVDGGIEEKQPLKAIDPDDVGTSAKGENAIAPKPSDSQASIIAPALKEPGKDEASVVMENKADDSHEGKVPTGEGEPKKDAKVEKADEEKKTEEKKEEPKKEEKTEEVKKSIDDSTYKVVETVRPLIKARSDPNGKPTAYQMLKAVEQGFGETKDAAQSLILMHQKMLAGEFGDGNPSRGGY